MNHEQALQQLMEGDNDWMIGGSQDPEANRAYGFREAQVAQAAVTAYITAFERVRRPDRAALHRLFYDRFAEEVGLLMGS